MAKEENGKWITVKGTHVFIPDGKRPSEVLKSKFKLQGKSTEKYNKERTKIIEKGYKQYKKTGIAGYPGDNGAYDKISKEKNELRRNSDQGYKEVTKGFNNIPQRTAPKGQLSGMDATNALDKLEKGMPVSVTYGKGEPKQAIYLGKSPDEGRYQFYDGEGVNGRFDFSGMWLKDNDTVKFDFENNDPFEVNRLLQQVKGKGDESLKADYMKIPQEERVKAYEEGKNWKDLVKEKQDDFERWKEENNEKIASYYTETYSDDLKNINEDIWNSIAKDIYDEEKLPEKINKEYEEPKEWFTDEDGVKVYRNEYGTPMLREEDAKKREEARKREANKEKDELPEGLQKWYVDEDGVQVYRNEYGTPVIREEDARRREKGIPNYKEDDDFESVSKELSEIANRTGKHDLFSEAGKRWDELYKQDKNNVSKDLGDGYRVGVGYGGTISMRSIHPYDETDYAYAEKNNGKWVVRNPLTNARTTFDTRDEALQEMKAIDKIIKTGEPVMDNEGVSRYLPPKSNESSWSRKMRENKAKTVDERKKSKRYIKDC